jgi:hypothetical protein
MTAADRVKAVAMSESTVDMSTIDTNTVELPLFLAPPPTAQASARAAHIAEARAAAEDNPSSPPVLRFSAGN